MLFMLALLVALVASTALMASVPPVSRDALVHHLAVPKLYLQQGGIYEIPSIKYSYYPMNLELLYLVPLYFNNDILPKFIHFAFALLTGGLIFNYLNQRLNRHYALFGVLTFLSLPVVVKLGITAYVDLGLVFFSTAALLLIFKWIQTDYDIKQLMLAGLFCGLALGTKYNGLLVLFLLALFIPYIYARLNVGARAAGTRALAYGGLFIMVALVVFAPWMIKNYLWTQNPLFPLYDRFFNPEAPFPSVSLGHFAVRRMVYDESWLQIALIPLRIFFQGQDNDPQYFDGQLNPFLLVLPLFAFRRAAGDPPAQVLERQLLAAFAIFFILYAFFTKDMRIRYIAPVAPALVLLAMFGLRNLFAMLKNMDRQISRRALKVLVNSSLVVMLVLNGLYIIAQFREVAPVGYISGQVDRAAYIQKYRPEYAVLQYANTHLSTNARMLAVFLGRRSYYADREMVFGIDVLAGVAKAARAPEEIWRTLADRRLTHVVVGRKLYDRWFQETFNAKERRRLQEFWGNHTVLIYRQAGYELYRLQNKPS